MHSAVYAMALCYMSARPSVRLFVCHKPVSYCIETAERIELVWASVGLCYEYIELEGKCPVRILLFRSLSSSKKFHLDTSTGGVGNLVHLYLLHLPEKAPTQY